MLVPLSEMTTIARTFVSELPKSLGSRAHTVGLSGDLGAGKTTFVQHVAKVLGVTRAVTSPTFVIAERYLITHAPFTSLIHVDAYRLGEGEAATIGWDKYQSDPQNLVLVEWPENLGALFPSDAPRLFFSVVDESTRDVTYV